MTYWFLALEQILIVNRKIINKIKRRRRRIWTFVSRLFSERTPKLNFFERGPEEAKRLPLTW
jgi:hypothetical protein